MSHVFGILAPFSTRPGWAVLEGFVCKCSVVGERGTDADAAAAQQQQQLQQQPSPVESLLCFGDDASLYAAVTTASDKKCDAIFRRVAISRKKRGRQ